MTFKRKKLEFWDDWDPMFPVQALFNSINDDSFVEIVKHLTGRQGYSRDYCHCHFPDDLDPAEPRFVSVRFSHFQDMIDISEKRFAEILRTVCESHKWVDPSSAIMLSHYCDEFTQSIDKMDEPHDS